MIALRQLEQAVRLLEGYLRREPLHLYLARAFKRQKRIGARDRRLYRALLYSYFRVGGAMKGLALDEQIVAGTVVFQPPEARPWLDKMLEHYPALAVRGHSAHERLHRVPASWQMDWRFPYAEALSPEMSFEEMQERMLRQPSVFIRIRHGEDTRVVQELNEQNIAYDRLDEHGAYRLPPQVRLHDLKTFQQGRFEIQDVHSQQSLRPFRDQFQGKWWDVCAGAGGKSLLMHHLYSGVQLWATDLREAALGNLRQRVQRQNVPMQAVMVRDLSRQPPPPEWPQFDGLLVDAPCTGSGTWTRTPESRFYPPGKPHEKAQLQQSILKHALPGLKTGGLLLYVTCSVYRQENEAIARWLQQEHGMALKSMQYFKTHLDADVIFVAAMHKN